LQKTRCQRGLIRGCLVCGLLNFLSFSIGAAVAAESRALVLSRELPAYLLHNETGRIHRLAPGTNEIMLIGEWSPSDKALSDDSHLRVRLPDGSVRPLWIEANTLAREFGQVVFLRFAASVPAAAANQGGLSLESGDDVWSPNLSIPVLAVDPARADAFRVAGFARANPAAANRPDSRELRVSVVADSVATQNRRISQLLFLLPIALVVVAAGARSLLRRNRHDGE